MGESVVIRSLRSVPHRRVPQLLFAIIRPRYRQVYGLREWFVQQPYVSSPNIGLLS